MTDAVCWCGRPPGEHDGRELDANNDLHVFGRPVRPEKELPREEFPSAIPAKAASRGLPVDIVHLLIRVQKFLDGEIVAQANAGTKIPSHTVRNASALAAAVRKAME